MPDNIVNNEAIEVDQLNIGGKNYKFRATGGEPAEYLKSASVNNKTLTITPKTGADIVFNDTGSVVATSASTITGADTIKAITVDGTDHNLHAGSTVTASGDAATGAPVLKSLTIDDILWSIPEGSGGGGSGDTVQLYRHQIHFAASDDDYADFELYTADTTAYTTYTQIKSKLVSDFEYPAAGNYDSVWIVKGVVKRSSDNKLYAFISKEDPSCELNYEFLETGYSLTDTVTSIITPGSNATLYRHDLYFQHTWSVYTDKVYFALYNTDDTAYTTYAQLLAKMVPTFNYPACGAADRNRGYSEWISLGAYKEDSTTLYTSTMSNSRDPLWQRQSTNITTDWSLSDTTTAISTTKLYRHQISFKDSDTSAAYVNFVLYTADSTAYNTQAELIDKMSSQYTYAACGGVSKVWTALGIRCRNTTLTVINFKNNTKEGEFIETDDDIELTEYTVNDIVTKIYDSSLPSTADFNQLANRPAYNGTTMSSTTNIPEVKTAVWDAKSTVTASISPVAEATTAQSISITTNGTTTSYNLSQHLYEHHIKFLQDEVYICFTLLTSSSTQLTTFAEVVDFMPHGACFTAGGDTGDGSFCLIRYNSDDNVLIGEYFEVSCGEYKNYIINTDWTLSSSVRTIF